MTDDPPEFEVLLKHVDRADTRAVDGTEKEAPVDPEEKRRPMKPEVMAPNTPKQLRRTAAKQTPLIQWPWLMTGLVLGIGITFWITSTFY